MGALLRQRSVDIVIVQDPLKRRSVVPVHLIRSGTKNVQDPVKERAKDDVLEVGIMLRIEVDNLFFRVLLINRFNFGP